mmetsp:Transcript_3839/g.13844  ORF Transcript_3839/g.13844 Transcript_3839/m.13844 type:complete len:296 (+) Transcript_3839:618-1505(+)
MFYDRESVRAQPPAAPQKSFLEALLEARTALALVLCSSSSARSFASSSSQPSFFARIARSLRSWVSPCSLSTAAWSLSTSVSSLSFCSLWDARRYSAFSGESSMLISCGRKRSGRGVRGVWGGGQIELRRGSGRKAAHLVVELVHLLPSCLEQVGNVGLALLEGQGNSLGLPPQVALLVLLPPDGGIRIRQLRLNPLLSLPERLGGLLCVRARLSLCLDPRVLLRAHHLPRPRDLLVQLRVPRPQVLKPRSPLRALRRLALEPGLGLPLAAQLDLEIRSAELHALDLPPQLQHLP